MLSRCLLVLFALLASSQARADAIGGPPDDCPAGSYGVSSHSGEWCEATTCRSDDQCTDNARMTGTVCRRSVGLCVRTETYRPGGRRPPNAPVRLLTRHVATGPCTRSTDCEAPARCLRARRCVPPTWTPNRARAAIGCAAVPSSGSPLALLAFALLFFRRSR